MPSPLLAANTNRLPPPHQLHFALLSHAQALSGQPAAMAPILSGEVCGKYYARPT